MFVKFIVLAMFLKEFLTMTNVLTNLHCQYHFTNFCLHTLGAPVAPGPRSIDTADAVVTPLITYKSDFFYFFLILYKLIGAVRIILFIKSDLTITSLVHYM